MFDKLMTEPTLTMSVLVDGVVKPVDVTVPESLDELPRSVRRKIRAATNRAAFTPTSTNSMNRPDLYPVLLDVGLVVLEHAGHTVNLDDEALTDDESEELEERLVVLGMRVMSGLGKAQATESSPSPSKKRTPSKKN